MTWAREQGCSLQACGWTECGYQDFWWCGHLTPGEPGSEKDFCSVRSCVSGNLITGEHFGQFGAGIGQCAELKYLELRLSGAPNGSGQRKGEEHRGCGGDLALMSVDGCGEKSSFFALSGVTEFEFAEGRDEACRMSAVVGGDIRWRGRLLA